MSHEAAHADTSCCQQPIPEHPLIPRAAPQLITSPDELAELIGHLRDAGRFAYDSEFIGEASFLPRLCLIQVATAHRISLIDTLARLDLSPFWNLVADRDIEKIVHAGQQDLEPVYRLIGRPAANILDVQIAAGFVGLAYPVGLSKLVKEFVGVHLGKGFTFTHWDRRPLSPVQLRYAADDVRYLPALHDALLGRLDELGHTGWAREESEALCDPALYQLDATRECLRIRGAGSLAQRNLAVLRELVIWRHQAAQRHDAPARGYLKDQVLVDLADALPTSRQRLARIAGLPRPVEEQEADHILAAVTRGMAASAEDLPVIEQNEESPAERFAIESLLSAIQAYCAGRSVDPALVTSRHEVARLYRHLREHTSLPQDHRLLRGWRAQLVGRLLADMFRGEGAVRLSWPNGVLRSERLNH